jgi:hypothetical protein
MSIAQEGGCLCGAVRYRVTGEPVVASACHCRYCQARSGSAFALPTYFNERDVQILRGTLTTYEHRSDESGRWLRTQFCPTCGTGIAITIEVRTGVIGIAGGTFDDPNWYRIDRHIWLDSARPWMQIPPGVSKYPQGSVGAPKAPAK